MEVGLRVVRGPDWMWADQDGGEGNVGTVVHRGQDGSLPDGTVLVYWDSGKQANYRAGHSGKFDLRVVDSAQSGLKHSSVTCDGCQQWPLVGTRWKCADCPDYDLCSLCFMNDVHDKAHSFLRFGKPQRNGVPVGKRINCTKVQSKGLFPGAKVTRGRDWKWGEQDGGSGRVGTLTEITAWYGIERAGAHVTWNPLSHNFYRAGYLGLVDLKCSTPATGPTYYRECLPKVGEIKHRPNTNRLQVGDRVSICLDADVLKAMSAGHGSWIDDMARYIGKVGTIAKIDADGDVHISYGLQSWVFHPDVVTKMRSFQAGDKVRVLSDKQLVQILQQGHGGWNESMNAALGKEGKILEVDSDGDAVVLAVGSDLWLFNPAALEDMSGGEATSRRGETPPTSPDSSLPPEIRARGPAAERAFQKAIQNGKVKVYRGRIMLLGQDRAGKTSLKKSLLGLTFNPQEESTVGVEVDPAKCEVEVDQVKNWLPTERKKLEVSEFKEDIARLIAKDLNETEAEKKDIGTADSPLKEAQLFPTQAESKSETSQNAAAAAVDTPSDSVAKEQSNTEHEIQLNIDTNATLRNDVTDLVVRYLQSLKLEDDIKAKEIILTLWDFAGQHLYYASHSVFLSERAVYVLVYNLNKDLMAEAEPCIRQGIHDIVLDNPNSETNLDNLLSWLVSIHSIRATDGEVNRDHKNIQAKLTYLRPPVFIVGTNADHPFQAAKEMTKCIQRNVAGKSYEKHVIRPFFTVDNTKSESDEGVKKLRKRIMEVLKQEPYMGEEVPLRWFNFERAVEALVAKKTYHMDLDQLQAVIRKVCCIDDQDEMAAMLNFYHDLGVIVKHGHTVVLQAQWLIDLFKKLITVRPFDEAVPLYSDCWKELEENGILRMALVDHVFTDFIEKGLNKQDILDMMELYGLIAKFSCLSSENEDEHRYFVPAQLRSSPAGLCELKPSAWDPCPLYVNFLDGFVPHGLFPQLLSRCIVWCSEHGLKEPPQLFNNGARLFIGAQTVFYLILVCKKRFIKVILKRSNPSSTSTSQKIAVEVRTFIERTLEGLSRDLPWLHNFRHELSVACAFCAKHSERCSKHGSICCRHDDCLHLLPVRPGEELICRENFSNEVIKVCGLEKWLQVQNSQNEEPGVDPLVSDGLDQPLSFKTGSPSSDDLLLVAHELGSSWKKLGRVLDLPEPVLEQIEEDERDVFEKCHSVLRKWTRAFGSKATYSCLARALQHPIVDRPHLAVKYCNALACVGPEKAVSARLHETLA